MIGGRLHDVQTSALCFTSWSSSSGQDSSTVSFTERLGSHETDAVAVSTVLWTRAGVDLKGHIGDV